MGVHFKDEHEPRRNDFCPCTSGLKYKHCHGDPCKVAVCNRIANEAMVHLVRKEQYERGVIPKDQYEKFLGGSKSEPVTEKDVTRLIESTGLKRCPGCGSPIPDNIEICIKCKKSKG